MGFQWRFGDNPLQGAVGLDAVSYLDQYDESTIMSTALNVPDFHQLSSLRGPLDLCISFMLLGTGFLISVSIAFIVARRGRPKSLKSALWYCMPYAEEEPGSEAGKRTRMLWVIAFAYVAIVYSSVLQSFVVVPEIQYEDMFDDICTEEFHPVCNKLPKSSERRQDGKV